MDWFLLPVVFSSALIVYFTGLAWKHSNKALKDAEKRDLEGLMTELRNTCWSGPSLNESQVRDWLETHGIGFDPDVPYVISEVTKCGKEA